jgi:aquaporin Z
MATDYAMLSLNHAEDVGCCTFTVKRETMRLMKAALAESIGTFFLVSTVALSAGQAAPLAPLAIGLSLVVMIFALGHISGAHFNSAVTLGVWLRGEIDLKTSAVMVVSQFAGGFAAAGIQNYVMGMLHTCNPGNMSMCSAGFPIKNPEVSDVAAVLCEGQYTFALVLVVLNVATTKAQKDNSFFGLAIGLTITVGAISAGNISGGAFNPVVGTVLPIVAGRAADIWIYWVGPLSGAALAALAFRLLANEDEFRRSV